MNAIPNPLHLSRRQDLRALADRMSLPRHRPTVALLAADPGWGEPSFGPAAWACARRARYWAQPTVVHAAAGDPTHYYRAALARAVTCR